MKRHRVGQRGERQRPLAKEVTSRGALSATSPRPISSRANSPSHPASGGFVVFLARWSSRGWLPGLLLVLATVLAYQPAWHGQFLWDDDIHIKYNRMLVEPAGLKQIWSSPDSPQYYPMVFTSFRLERALWGLNPTGYHWVNLLLHGASAVWVWRVLRRLKVPGAWLAAAIFALHPVNVESVAWISQRKNTLAMFFYLLSLLFYLRFDERAKAQSPEPGVGSLNPASRDTPHFSRLTFHALRFSSSWRLYGLSLFAFLLALLSKTAVSPFPLVLLSLAWWRRGKVAGRDLWRSAPFFAASLVLGLITVWFERHRTPALETLRDDSFWSRLAVAGRAVWFYLYKALLPLHLSFVYPRWQINPSRVLAYVPGALVVGALLLLWRYRRRWGRAWLFCAGYYVMMLLPVLGFVNIGFMRYSLVADHWQYFAIIGPIALASALFGSKLKTRNSKLEVSASGFSGALSPSGLFLAIVLLLTLGGLTWRRSALYANPERLWQEAFIANPGCWLAHYNFAGLLASPPGTRGAGGAGTRNNFGSILRQKGRVEEAITHFQSALRIKPDCMEACVGLGNAFLQIGQVDEAINSFQSALRIRPASELAHYNLGNALLVKREVDEAIAHYQKALELKPDYADAHCNLGVVLLQNGSMDEAIVHFRKALQCQPDHANAHSNLGVALFRQGNADEAIGHYLKALPSDPHNPNVHNNLGTALLQKERVDEAMVHFQKALETKADSADAHVGLGDAFVQKGNPAEAIAQYQKALQINPAAPEVQNSLAWLLATCPEASLRNGDTSVQLARQANDRAAGKNPVFLRTLAAAFAETGRFDDARRSVQKAIELAPTAGQQDLAGQLNDELKRYEAGLPLHP